jgi:hypothetical protein
MTTLRVELLSVEEEEYHPRDRPAIRRTGSLVVAVVEQDVVKTAATMTSVASEQ